MDAAVGFSVDFPLLLPALPLTPFFTLLLTGTGAGTGADTGAGTGVETGAGVGGGVEHRDFARLTALEAAFSTA